MYVQTFYVYNYKLCGLKYSYGFKILILTDFSIRIIATIYFFFLLEFVYCYNSRHLCVAMNSKVLGK